MAISKKKREACYAKCGGRCGYCGREITPKQMQVDHVWPQMLGSWPKADADGNYAPAHIDDMDNLMPSCRSCNHYKRSGNLDAFRRSMLALHERVQKIYILKVAATFGMVDPTVRPFDGTFYFERMSHGA